MPNSDVFLSPLSPSKVAAVACPPFPPGPAPTCTGGGTLAPPHPTGLRLPKGRLWAWGWSRLPGSAHPLGPERPIGLADVPERSVSTVQGPARPPRSVAGARGTGGGTWSPCPVPDFGELQLCLNCAPFRGSEGEPGLVSESLYPFVWVCDWVGVCVCVPGPNGLHSVHVSHGHTSEELEGTVTPLHGSCLGMHSRSCGDLPKC